MAPSGTVFRPFLDQSPLRPHRGRGFVASLVLHGVLALMVWWVWGRGLPGAPPMPVVAQVAVSLHPPLPRPAVVGRAAPLPAGASPRRAAPEPPRRAPARATPVVIAPAPEPAPDTQPQAREEGDPEPGALEAGTEPGAAGGGGVSEGGAEGEGVAGSRPGRRRPLELYGRVVGGGRRHMVGHDGVTYLPLKESTALRTYDVFPPLPAAQWASNRPYVVVLDVCVSGEGAVSDVALVKPASQTFDPVVLEAVRTWRYKPRLVDGHASAFCHVVAIKYEQL